MMGKRYPRTYDSSPTTRWSVRELLSHIGNDPLQFPRQGPPAVGGRPAQGDLGPPTDRGSVMRRADHIGQVQERGLDRKRPVPDRLDPPGIEARGARGMPLQVGKQRAFFD